MPVLKISYKLTLRPFKLSLLMFYGMMIILIGCGPSVDDDNILQTVSSDIRQQGYPDSGYPGPISVDAYPVPPSTDTVIQESPAVLPSFPGQIAFQTERFDGSLQVAMIDGSTGEITQLNQMFAQSFEPAWSPDCKSLIFTVGQESGSDFELYRQVLQSVDATLFLNHTDFYDWGAAWSPVNDVIAYQTNEDALINVCFADTVGNELGCMERNGFSNAMPAWSPDGSQIVFSSNREGNWELYIIDYPALSSVNRLTEDTGTDFDPVFASDGSTILFSSQRGADYNLFSIEANGQNEQQLTSDGADERFPTWVGENLIAYAAGFQEELELYLMNADGSNPQRLTYSLGKDEWPSWCAVP